MRIVMVGPFGMEPRGTMRVRALPLARALVARGHDVRIVMPPWHTPSAPPRTWQDAGVRLEYVSLGPRLAGLHHLAVSIRLLRRALADRPDALYWIKPIGYAGLALRLATWGRRLGVHRGRIWVDADDWEGEGGWNVLAARGWIARRLIAHQERRALTHADAVTVASRTLQSLVWSLGVPPERVHYLPNGCTPSHRGDGDGARERYGLGSDPVVLLYTRFFEFDVARPLAVFGRVLAQRPDARLFVVGKALYPEQDERFDGLVRSLGMSERVVRTGWLPMEALPDALAAADVALFPFDDTLVNRSKCAVKLVDLVAAGVPVVADAVGQNSTYIAHGESGLLVSAGDVEEMAAAVLQVLDDPALRARLSAGAACAMRERYDWGVLAGEALRALAV